MECNQCRFESQGERQTAFQLNTFSFQSQFQNVPHLIHSRTPKAREGHTQAGRGGGTTTRTINTNGPQQTKDKIEVNTNLKVKHSKVNTRHRCLREWERKSPAHARQQTYKWGHHASAYRLVSNKTTATDKRQKPRSAYLHR